MKKILGILAAILLVVIEPGGSIYASTNMVDKIITYKIESETIGSETLAGNDETIYATIEETTTDSEFETTTEAVSNAVIDSNSNLVNINGVWYNSIADYYVVCGFTYIDKDTLISRMKAQFASGGTVNESYFYIDDDGENLVKYLQNGSGLYSSFASIAYKYIIRTTAGNATLGGYQVMCFETNTTSQMYLSDSELTAVDAKASSILSLCNGSSNVETVINVFNWFKNNVSYDYSYTRGNAYDALLTNSCVCAGYASAFQYIMEKAGIPCKIVTGLTSSNVAHAWNAVYVAGKWYYVDCTYGAGSNSNKWLLFGTNMLADIYSIGISDSSYDASSAGTAKDVEEAESKFYSNSSGGVSTGQSVATIKAGTDTSVSTAQETVASDETSVIEDSAAIEVSTPTYEKLSNLSLKVIKLKEKRLDKFSASVSMSNEDFSINTINSRDRKTYNKEAALAVVTGFGACALGGFYAIAKNKFIKQLLFKRKFKIVKK
mgnify:CR=1 FL=1